MRVWKWLIFPVLTVALLAAADQGQVGQPAANARLRLELFVSDISRSVRFYQDVLGFDAVNEEKGYASLRRGTVELGIGSIADLPSGHYFMPELGSQRRGLGAEIVIEVDDVKAAFERVERCKYPIITPLRKRPWGLSDFRIADPDGYYLRISSSEQLQSTDVR